MLIDSICLSSRLTSWVGTHLYPFDRGNSVGERLARRIGRVVTVTLTASLLVVISRIEHVAYTVLAGCTAPLLLWNRTRAIPHLFQDLRLSASFTTWRNVWNIPLSFQRMQRGDLNTLTANESLARQLVATQGMVSTRSNGWFLIIDALVLLPVFLLFPSYPNLLLNLYNVPHALLSNGDFYRDLVLRPLRTPAQGNNRPPTPPQPILNTISRKYTGLEFLQKYYTQKLIGDKYDLILEQDPVVYQFVAERCVYLLSISPSLAFQPIPNFLKENTILYIRAFRAILACKDKQTIPNSIYEIPIQWDATTQDKVAVFWDALTELDTSSSLFSQQINEIRDLLCMINESTKGLFVGEVGKTKMKDLQKQLHYLLITWATILQSTEKEKNIVLLEEFFGAKYPIDDASLQSQQRKESPLQKRLRLQIQMIANLEWNDHATAILTNSSLAELVRRLN